MYSRRPGDRIVVRGGYGLNYNQEEIAISANIVNNPGLVVAPFLGSASPTSINPDIIYAHFDERALARTAMRRTPTRFRPLGRTDYLLLARSVSRSSPTPFPTMYVHHYSLDVQDDLGHNWIMSLGYLGSKSRNLFFH